MHLHLHGNSRDKAALKRLARQVYTMTTYTTCLLKLGWCSWRLSPTERLWAASAHATKSHTGITPLGTPCCRALLVLVSRTEMQPVSVQGMGFYPGAGKLQRELSYSWAVFQTLFLFSPKSLCNPCFKALKARDYSGNAKPGWHIVAFADSLREDNKICISFFSW